jgi:hypothetical protein
VPDSLDGWKGRCNSLLVVAARFCLLDAEYGRDGGDLRIRSCSQTREDGVGGDVDASPVSSSKEQGHDDDGRARPKGKK